MPKFEQRYPMVSPDQIGDPEKMREVFKDAPLIGGMFRFAYRIEPGNEVHVRWPRDEDNPVESLSCMTAVVTNVTDHGDMGLGVDVARHKSHDECSGLTLTSGIPHSSKSDFVSWHLPEECE